MLLRNYLKEEEFLAEFYNWAAVASQALSGEWNPNHLCDDSARKQRDYFLQSGELSNLAFMSASVQRTPEAGVVAQIVLRSSKRQVTVKVGEGNSGEVVAQLVRDTKA